MKKNSLIFFVTTLIFFLAFFVFNLFLPAKTSAIPICDGFGCSFAPCSAGPSACGVSPGACSTQQANVCNSSCSDSCDCASQPGNTAWTKYATSCVEDPPGSCKWVWVYDTVVGSTGDKCHTNPYNSYSSLNAGSCDPNYPNDTNRGNLYKTCCAGSNVSSSACSAYSIDTVNPPYEGSCPSGTSTVMCGVSLSTCQDVCGGNNCFGSGVYCTTSACGTNACQAIFPPPPSTCSDGTPYNTCKSGSPPTYCNGSGSLVNACGTCGCPSDQVCKVDGSCGIPPPSSPSSSSLNTSQACQANGTVTATLSWGSVSGATGYRVYKWTGSVWQLLPNGDVTTTNYSWTNLSQNTGYTWGVSAYNSAGESDISWSSNSGFTSQICPPPPPAPTDRSCDVFGYTINLSWSASANATSYQIALTDTTTNTTSTITTGNVTSYPASITPNHDYTWSIKACNSAGCSNTATTGSGFTCYEPKASCKVPDNLAGAGTWYGDVNGNGSVDNQDIEKISKDDSSGAVNSWSQSLIERGDVFNSPSDQTGANWGVQSVVDNISFADALKVARFLDPDINETLPVCSVVQPTPVVCTDGVTQGGFCKSGDANKPKYCPYSGGALVDNCSGTYETGSPACGCVSPKVCNTTTRTCGTPTPTPTGPPPPTYKISGSFFIDTDDDGVKDLGESLYTATVPTIKIGTTNPNSNSGGNYTFSDLAGGMSYNIQLTEPSGYVISHGGVNPNTNPRTVAVTSADAVNVNFGLKSSSVTSTPTPTPTTAPIALKIYGTAYIDYDGDAVRDAGEPPYNSGTFNFIGLSSSGSCSGLTYPVTTGPSGDYSIDVNPDTNYSLHVRKSYDYPDVIQDHAIPANVLGVCGGTDTSGQYVDGYFNHNITKTDQQRDIGMRPLYDVGGAIYIDNNNNGVRDAGEPNYVPPTGFVPISVDGGFAGSKPCCPYTLSDSFLGNPNGVNHTLQITVPSGYILSYGVTNPNTNPRTVTVVTSDVSNVNFGLLPLGTLDIFVYYDIDNNGQFDIGGADYGYTGSVDVTVDGTTRTLSFANSSPYWQGYTGVSYSSGGINHDVSIKVTKDYVLSFNGAPPNQNPRVVSVTTDGQAVYFGLLNVSSQTISGKRVADNDGSGTYNAGDTDISGSFSVDYAKSDGSSSGTVFATDLGVYTIAVSPGQYSVTYGPVPPAGMKKSFPSTSHLVTVGPGICDLGGTGADAGATCDASGNISGLNFGFRPYSSWIQSVGADLRFDNGFYNPVPSGQFSSVGDTDSNSYPGIIFSGDSAPDTGLGGISSTNWRVYGAAGTSNVDIYTPSKGVLPTSYDYVEAKLVQAGVEIKPNKDLCGQGNTSSCSLNPSVPNGVYKVTGDMNLRFFPSGSFKGKILILVSGSLDIGLSDNPSANKKITVPKGASLTFIVKGDIIVDANIGEDENKYYETGTRIEGFFSTDKSFIVNSINSCTGTADKRLNMGGTIIVNAARAGGAFMNNRSLCSNNFQHPSFTIKARPDFIITAPESIKQTSTVYQEVAP